MERLLSTFVNSPIRTTPRPTEFRLRLPTAVLESPPRTLPVSSVSNPDQGIVGFSQKLVHAGMARIVCYAFRWTCLLSVNVKPVSRGYLRHHQAVSILVLQIAVKGISHIAIKASAIAVCASLRNQCSEQLERHGHTPHPITSMHSGPRKVLRYSALK